MIDILVPSFDRREPALAPSGSRVVDSDARLRNVFDHQEILRVVREIDKIGRIGEYGATELAVAIGQRLPAPHHGGLPRLGNLWITSLTNADGLGQTRRAAFDSVVTLEPIEILPRIESNALDLVDRHASRVPRWIGQLENQPDWAVCQHPRFDEVR